MGGEFVDQQSTRYEYGMCVLAGLNQTCKSVCVWDLFDKMTSKSACGMILKESWHMLCSLLFELKVC